MTAEIDALIADLRQPGGDDQGLSNRFARALGWVFRPFVRYMGHIQQSRWISPAGDYYSRRPLFTDNLTAIAGMLPENYDYEVLRVSPSAWARVFECGRMLDFPYHEAPTAERALMIARLVLLKEAGK
jgi:hypothetical protein